MLRGGKAASILCLIGVALAASSARAATAADAAGSTLGTLPYSNQWIYDERSSFIYLTVTDYTLDSHIYEYGDFTTFYPSQAMTFVGMDYFGRVARLRSGEERRGFSIWARYGLGLGVKEGTLSNPAVIVGNEVETSHLLVFLARLGPVLSYEGLGWIQPYISVGLSPFWFRHTASLNGAEGTGAGLLTEEDVGLHLPVLCGGACTFLAEARLNQAAWGEKKILGSDFNFALGAGFAF